MTEDNFKKGIEGLKNIRMTDAEKTRMLKRIFATPIKSPYMKRIPVFAYALSLFLIISLGGATYTSGVSLPGDLFYPIKTKFVEPMLDVVNNAPEEKVVWEEQKVTRRIVEAEMLAEKDELSDERIEELGRKIEESSRAFVKAAEEANGGKAKSRKEEFRRKINERKEISDQEDEENGERDSERQGKTKKVKIDSKTEKVKRLKDTAIRVVDDEDEEDND